MDIIHSYTREQAIADGNLIDVTTTAREAGFRVPVAVTAAAYYEAVAWDNGAMQSEAGRLWDVLVIAHFTAKRSTPASGPHSSFTLYRVPNHEDAEDPEELDLGMHIGPGDNAGPVITIGLPGED